jgi:hypothetical protein
MHEGIPLRAAPPADQAQLGIYRALLLVQVAAAGFFGVFPFLMPDTFAALFGFAGDEPFIYRLLGAASLGYAAAALLGFGRPAWAEHRIPAVATLTFNLGAVVAAVVSLLAGDRQFLVFFILAAASAFSLVTAYWLVRDVGPAPPTEPALGPVFRILLAVATAAAAFFGLVPLFAPEPFASVAGFATTDLFIYRLAGAAALGYATAGVLEVLASSGAAIRLQVRAALVFNALSAVAAAVYVVGGGRSFLGWLILAAATTFTVVFAWWLAVTPDEPPAEPR